MCLFYFYFFLFYFISLFIFFFYSRDFGEVQCRNVFLTIYRTEFLFWLLNGGHVQEATIRHILGETACKIQAVLPHCFSKKWLEREK